MITKSKKSLLLIYTVVILLVGIFFSTKLIISGVENLSVREDEKKLTKIELLNSDDETRYIDYLDKYNQHISNNYEKKYDVETVLDSSIELIDADSSFGYGQKIIKLETKQSASFNLDVEVSGLYEIYLDYYFASESINDVEGNFKINGDYPYYEARQVLFKSDWEMSSDIKTDRYGNEIIPNSSKVIKWYSHQNNQGILYDGSRLYNGTFKGYFSEGENSLEISITSGSLYIGAIYLVQTKELEGYNSYINDYENETIIKEISIVEPEKISIKNDIGIRIYSDADPKSTPYETKNKKLNSIYLNSWNKSNQSVTWNIEVDESGLYNISFKYIQSTMVDLPVHRDIYIDGEVPFKELENYRFEYAKKWTNESLNIDREKIYVYLDKGIHTITMASTIDPYRDIILALDEIMEEMSDISIQIKALSNGQTDEYRDWKITDYIPTLRSDIENWMIQLDKIIDAGNSISPSKKGSTEFSNLSLAINKLEKLLEDVDQIPNRMSEFTDGDSSVLTYIGNVKLKLYECGLGLEKIYLGDGKIPTPRANFFVKIWESIKKFFLSFTDKQYNSTQSKDDETLEVWVRRSRQYIEVMQMMADEAGVDVKFSIMPDQNKLVLANSSGDLPDLAMGIDNWIPYDLALRGITVDLRDFEGYEEVVSTLNPGSMIPYAYEDGMYGLPENQDFWILFYRTDILEDLNIDTPKTWDEVLGILPQLQRYGLNFYHPISLYTGLRPFNVTLPFFYQWGGNIYSDDGMSTTLSNEENIKALKFMTDLYTIYNLDKEVTSFYNYFRNGTLPIGIANSGTYLQLMVAAPEIKGNWNVGLHPGYENEDGSINHYATASSQGLTMFKTSDKKEEAWEFIKWWMSTDTQEEYISRLYSMYGEEYLWFSANREAFLSIPIPTEHKEIILEQLDYGIEVSRIPAAYVIEQTISDAFSKVVFNGENVRIALDNAVITSNREIERKMEEFGYMKNGEKVKDYLVPTIYNIESWLKERS